MELRLYKKTRAVLIIVVSYLLLTTYYLLPVFSQGVEQSIDLVIESTPVDPAPGEMVILEAKSFSVDLNLATLNWQYSGKPVASGLGRTRISVIAPKSGATAVAAVTVSSGGIAPVSASIVLSPGSVDLLWEAIDSSVPPFYKGKALLSTGGLFRVVAIPAGGAPRQTSYQWSRNDSAVPAASGLGRSSIVFRNTIFNKQDSISVSVAGGLFQGAGKISVGTRAPSVIAYQKDDGFIEYANGFDKNISLFGPGAILRLEPYYFSVPKNKYIDLVYETKIGSETIYPNGKINELRFSRPQESVLGDLLVKITTRDYSLQNVEKEFSLRFD